MKNSKTMQQRETHDNARLPLRGKGGAGNFEITILRGVSNNAETKRNALHVPGEFLVIVSFWLLTKTSSRVRIILGKFQEIKTKVKKKNRGQSVYLVQPDGCIYVVRGVMQERLPKFHAAYLPRNCFRLAEGRNPVLGKYLATLTNF